MKEFLLVLERIVRAIALCIVIYFLILASAYFLIVEGYDTLIDYLDDLFNTSSDYEIYFPIFRLSFIYIFVTSIYGYVRFRKFVWSDLFKRENYYSAVWDKHGHYVFIIFCFGIVFTAWLLVYLEIYPACTFTGVSC